MCSLAGRHLSLIAIQTWSSWLNCVAALLVFTFLGNALLHKAGLLLDEGLVSKPCLSISAAARFGSRPDPCETEVKRSAKVCGFALSAMKRKCVQKQGFSGGHSGAYLLRVLGMWAHVQKVLFAIGEVATMASRHYVDYGFVREGNANLHMRAAVRVAVWPAVAASVSVPMEVVVVAARRPMGVTAGEPYAIAENSVNQIRNGRATCDIQQHLLSQIRRVDVIAAPGPA